MRLQAAGAVALCAFVFAGSVHADLLVPAVDEALREPLRLVTSWERGRLLAFLLVVAVFLFGAVIVLFQTLPSAKARAGAIVLGCAVTLLMALGNASLVFDHRQYQAMASQGRHLLAQAEARRSQLQAVRTDQEQMRLGLFEDIRKDVNAVLQLQATHEQRLQPGTASVMALARAFEVPAAAPDWVTKVPADPTWLYFVGVAGGTDYAAAKQASLESAHASARAFLAERLGGGAQGQAAGYLLESARIVDTHVEFDGSHQTVRHYTLLALSRKVAESDLRLYRARHSQSALPIQESWLHAAAANPNQAYSR